MKNIGLLSLLLLLANICFAQSEATSARMSFNIVKEVRPPLWEVVEQPYFVDADGNNAIDVNESCKIVMKLKNVGMGDGIGLIAKISAEGHTNGIVINDKELPTIKMGSVATVEFPIQSNMNTVDGSVEFMVYVDEPLGFNTDPYKIKVQTRKFQSPLIVVQDYVVSGDNSGVLEKMKPFTLQVLLQNIQQGVGENVTVKLDYPENVFNVDGQDLYSFPQWEAGVSKTLQFQLLVSGIYEGTSLPLKVIINEKYKKYGENKEINLILNQPLVQHQTIEVDAQITQTDIVNAQLRSDVDKNIPQVSRVNPHRYAIIIGNYDYHSYQNGLNSEQDVPFAAEDAAMFKEYCKKTLGVKAENISFLTNATAAKMNQEIDYITRLAARDPEAEVIFYYAGHGFPDENTKEPYLIPVDVNAATLTSAIALYDLYQKLSATNAQQITVFLDACFSGGGRDMGLLASRGIKITPKKETLTGNIVVFSATTADQVALPYSDKKHGMFTYFLLKKLQESRGECTYGELYDYLNRNVGENSLRENRKDQIPEVNTSQQVQSDWRNWRFNDNK